MSGSPFELLESSLEPVGARAWSHRRGAERR
jgi:hypothetical protein